MTGPRLGIDDEPVADADRDGLNVITAIRAWSPVPIIVLSARTAEAQRLAAFENGADDYVMKPFSASELLARVRAIVRRH